MVGRENDMPNERYEADGVPSRLRWLNCRMMKRSYLRVCGCKMINGSCSRGLWRIADSIMDDLTLSMERKKLISRTKKRRGKSLIVDNIK